MVSLLSPRLEQFSRRSEAQSRGLCSSYLASCPPSVANLTNEDYIIVGR